MSDKHPIEATLDIFLEQVRELERQMAEKKRTVNELCQVLGRPPLFEAVGAAAGFSTRADEYYGRPASEVIKAILEKRQQASLGAASVAEIYDAMIAGGYVFQTANELYAKRGIYSILSSDPTFHRLPNGRIGLASWYPAVKAKAAQEERKTKKPRLKRSGKRGTRKPRKSPVANKQVHQEGELSGIKRQPDVSRPQSESTTFARGELLKKVEGIVLSLSPKFNTVDVVERLNAKTGEKVHHGSVRVALSRLEKKGVVQKVSKGGSGKTPSVYKVVEAGAL